MDNNCNESYNKVRNFLVQNLIQEYDLYYGNPGSRRINFVADAWMNDKSNSQQRYKIIREFFHLSKNSKILDMSSGCGTFVFYGLLNGYDVRGIEPERWKNEFNKMKIRLYDYPEDWESRFAEAFGENLPFPNESFDIVSSYQTLEHVSNVEACLQEMLRVIKKEGIIFLHFPDYRSTFEGHYLLPWIPLFPKTLARFYLRILNRPVLGLDKLNYVTKQSIISLLRARRDTIEIIDMDRIAFSKRTKKLIRKFNLVKIGYAGKILALIINIVYAYFCVPFRRVFRSEKDVTILVRKI